MGDEYTVLEHTLVLRQNEQNRIHTPAHQRYRPAHLILLREDYMGWENVVRFLPYLVLSEE